jgi:hypothetical protein
MFVMKTVQLDTGKMTMQATQFVVIVLRLSLDVLHVIQQELLVLNVKEMDIYQPELVLQIVQQKVFMDYLMFVNLVTQRV